VTRLGEFSPNERIFSLGNFTKIKKVAHILYYISPKLLFVY
jgi:hypothetical protein